VVSFTPRPLYLRGKSPRYPLDRRLGGPQRRFISIQYYESVLSWLGCELDDQSYGRSSTPECAALQCHLPGLHFFPHPFLAPSSVFFSFSASSSIISARPRPSPLRCPCPHNCALGSESDIDMWGGGSREPPPHPPESVSQLPVDELLEGNFSDDTSQTYRRCLRAPTGFLCALIITARSLLTYTQCQNLLHISELLCYRVEIERSSRHVDFAGSAFLVYFPYFE
jgi:hypothetical protein